MVAKAKLVRVTFGATSGFCAGLASGVTSTPADGFEGGEAI